MNNLESKLNRRDILKLALAGTAYLLNPFTGCSSSKETKTFLEDIAIEKLIEKGEYFHQFGNFGKINSLDHVSGNKYKMNVHFEKCFTNPNGFDEDYTLEVQEVQVFPAYQDEDFAQYISKWYPGFGGSSLKKKIVNGEIKVVGSVKIIAEHSIHKSTKIVSCLLEKNQDDSYEWRFVTKNRAVEHSILKAFKNAYAKEKDEDFQRFK